MITAAHSGDEARVALRARGLWKAYDQGAITVLRGVDLDVHAGQTAALCGASGCG